MTKPLTVEQLSPVRTSSFDRAKNWWLACGPGVLISTTIALAAMFVSEHYGGPVMLYALLLGIAFNFVSEDKKFQAGIQFSAKTVLRIGVALLGVRVTISEIAGLGLPTVSLVVGGLTFTIVVGWAIGRLLGLKSDHAILSAGAVAICGASAALAISAALPQHKNSERNTILTVVGVTALSTVAMVVYPMITQMMGLSDEAAGVFIGATIHDVAQVVGAGYTISESAGDTSAVVKLMRVTCLAPVVFLVAILFNQRSDKSAGEKVSVFPLFLIAFIALVVANSFGLIPAPLVSFGSDFSKVFLVVAVAALGCKTSLTSIVKVGPRPVLALSFQTILLALFALIGLTLVLT